MTKIEKRIKSFAKKKNTPDFEPKDYISELVIDTAITLYNKIKKLKYKDIEVDPFFNDGSMTIVAESKVNSMYLTILESGKVEIDVTIQYDSSTVGALTEKEALSTLDKISLVNK